MTDEVSLEEVEILKQEELLEDDLRKDSSFRTRVGSVTSLIVLLVGLFLAIYSEVNFLELGLDGKGDFIAGIFSPIALMWLVIGYFQNSDELRINSLALKRQVTEASYTTTQLSRRVEVAERRFASEMETTARKNELIKLRSQPMFRDMQSARTSLETKGINFSLGNVGVQCFDIKIYLDPIHSEVLVLENESLAILRHGERLEGLRLILMGKNYPAEIVMHISYVDELLESETMRLVLRQDGEDLSLKSTIRL